MGTGTLCHAHHNVATRTRMAGGNVQRNLRTGLFRALGGMVQDSSRSARATLGGWWIVGGHSMRALACAAIATTAFGQTQPGTDPWFRGFDLRLTYYECIRPAEEPPCVALTEEEQEERCPGCLEWRLEVLGNRVVVEFDRSAYLLADPVARESAFVRDFAEAAYGAGSFPLREDGSAVTTGDLFRNYERYGWVRLAPGNEKAGALAVWGNHAGVVLDDGASLLHPSDALGGRLSIDSVEALGLGQPQYIVPEALVRE